ncbi:MAG TPA: lysophospholipid acyltransferase family protein [Gemmatimonadaceae bacterium]|nr:lysophospholipid acyltransferase family protein [Gemmatimonadaceae bacterium]
MSDDPARERRRRRRIAWAVRLGPVVLRLLAMTWRVRELDGERIRRPLRERRPFVAVFWHGQMLPLLWHHRNRGIAILISEHGDGEIIARIAQRLGYALVRGSTSRGAERALLESIRLVSSGAPVAITPDGPRGPARSFAAGALLVSHRSKAPILPVAASASRAWRLRSWDRFMIPKPFARVTVAYGPPDTVQAASARDAAAQTTRYHGRLEELGASIGA